MRYWWLIVTLLPVGLFGQGEFRAYLKHSVRNWPAHSLAFVAGCADGTADALKHHYSSSIFPQSGPRRQFFDPAVSWENKYRDWPVDQRAAYPGAKTWLVWTTDAWHMAKTVRNKSMQAAPFVWRMERDNPARRWWWPVADFAASSLLFSIGWHTADVILVK